MLPENKQNMTDDTADLRELIEAVQNSAPPVGAYERARSRLNDRLDNEPKENWIMSALKNTANRKGRAITVGGLALAAVLLVVMAIGGGNGHGNAYAAVAQQLREALVVSFDMEWRTAPGAEPADIRVTLRNPGLQRMEMKYDGARQVHLTDTNNNKLLVVFPDQKAYMEADLSNVHSVDHERLELLKLLDHELKTLPDEAVALEGTRIVNSRRVKGYRTGSKTLWLDAETGELALIDSENTGANMRMSNFRIDDTAHTEADFSLTPPDGYQNVNPSGKRLTLDASGATEDALVEYLLTTSYLLQGDRFPKTTNPMEISAAVTAGTIREFPEATAQERQLTSERFALTAYKAVHFVMQMKPANDFHYDGEGVVRGEASVPIAWWKPDGSETYRVIWGDLTITDETLQGQRPVR